MLDAVLKMVVDVWKKNYRTKSALWEEKGEETVEMNYFRGIIFLF